jgi:hypothetical protein
VTLPPGFSTGYHSHEQDLIFVITAGAKLKGTSNNDDFVVGSSAAVA